MIIQKLKMTNTELYLPTVLPQWGIFAGVVLLTIGFIEKKRIWTILGWSVLIITGLAGLYFNYFGDLTNSGARNGTELAVNLLISTGWQLLAGGVLAGASLLLFHLKRKRYPVLAILTIIYFVLIFFLYTQVSALSGKSNRSATQKRIEAKSNSETRETNRNNRNNRN